MPRCCPRSSVGQMPAAGEDEQEEVRLFLRGGDAGYAEVGDWGWWSGGVRKASGNMSVAQLQFTKNKR